MPSKHKQLALHATYGQIEAQVILNRISTLMKAIAPDHEGKEWQVSELADEVFLFLPPNYDADKNCEIRLPNSRFTRAITMHQAVCVVSLLFTKWVQFKSNQDISPALLEQNHKRLMAYIRAQGVSFRVAIASVVSNF